MTDAATFRNIFERLAQPVGGGVSALGATVARPSSGLILPFWGGSRRTGIHYERADGTPGADPAPETGAALAADALERNVFAAPWMMEAAAAHLVGGKNVRVLVSGASGNVCGMLPVVLPRHRVRLPVAKVWAHLHCFDTTPLIGKASPDRFFDDMFAWLDRYGIAVLRWPRVALDGAFFQELSRYLQRTGRASAVIASHSRPTLRAGTDGEGGVDRILSAKRRREIGRCRRRLAEIGALAFRCLEHSDEIERWAAEFLRLEASGWKGGSGSGTALACREAERAFFLQSFQEAARRGQLIAHGLELDGALIAMTVNYRCGDVVWAYKTAYDERYARFAPGAILEVDGAQAMLDDPTISWADSCSEGDNALIQELWSGRREMGDLVIAIRPGRGVALPVYLKAARAQFAARAKLRALYWRLADWRRRRLMKKPS